MKKIVLYTLAQLLVMGLFAQTCADGNAGTGSPAARFISNGQIFLEWSTDAAAMTVFGLLNSTGSINYNGTNAVTAEPVNQTVVYSDLRNPGANPFRIRTNVSLPVTSGGPFTGTITMTFDDGSTLQCVYDNGDLQVPTPVELLRFEAKPKNEMVQINWTTASEVDNNYVAVERSADGMEFLEIGRVTGQGNSFSEKNYNINDEEPLTGTSYYRLKQVDYNEKVNISEIVSVNREGGKFSIRPSVIYNGQTISIDLVAYKNVQVKITVSNLAGNQLLQRNMRGGSLETLNLNSLTQGIYIISVLDGSSVSSDRIIVMN